MTDIKPDLVVMDLPDASPSDPLEALSWLGEEPWQIAHALKERGIKGRKRNAQSCPLANYLSIFWPESQICVGGAIGFIDDVQYTAHENFSIFVGMFDTDLFPFLVETEP